MPTYPTIQAAKQNSPTAKNLNAVMDSCAAVCFFQTLYVTTGSEVTGDVIDIIDIPVGAQLLPETVRVITDGVGGTSTVVSTIGDASVANRYSTTTVAIVSAGQTQVTPTNAIALTPVLVTAATQRLKAVLSFTGSLTANKNLRFTGQYLMPNG